jgi:hypothetical protein
MNDTSKLRAAEKVAKQLQEAERKKMEDQKRKRDQEEDWYRTCRRKVEEQRHKLEDEEKKTYQTNKEMYALFNDLQGIARE